VGEFIAYPGPRCNYPRAEILERVPRATRSRINCPSNKGQGPLLAPRRR